MTLAEERKAERLARVKDLTAQGYTAPEIAARLKVSTRTVVRYRHAAGCAQPPPRHLTADIIAAAGKLLDDGCPYEEAARTLGVSSWAIAARYPGRAWTRSQVAAFGGLNRWLRA